MSKKKIQKTERASVCLVMIVKNESEVIRRCIESVKDYIDYWVICDTGSTDDTKKIIQETMDEFGIKGELHDREWVDYGVLEATDEYGNTMGYVFVGDGKLKDYYGSKPMSINWQLSEPIPNYLWKESAKLAVG
jgi:glycosyltransferase involved in cell wall biosynthesis